MSDPETRRSKGVAFVLFLERDSAYKAARALNNTEVCLVFNPFCAGTIFICRNLMSVDVRC